MSVKKQKVYPSLLSCDMGFLDCELRLLQDSKADGLHIDVMDGHFVPNLALGLEVVKRIRSLTSLFMDVHLMVSLDVLERSDVFQGFLDHSDAITVHWEIFWEYEKRDFPGKRVLNSFGGSSESRDVCMNFFRAMSAKVRGEGKQFGLALKPSTPLEDVPLEAWSLFDFVLMMTVEPGFGGQKFLHSQVFKVQKAFKMLKPLYPHLFFSVDGGISKETAPLVAPFVDILVSGSYIFSGSYHKTLEELRKAWKPSALKA